MVSKNPNDPVEIGRRLRLLRLIISEEDHQTRWVASFHPKAPFTVQHWGNWEAGRHRPSPPAVDAIMRKTKATSDYILYGKMDNLPYELRAAIEERERMDESA